MTQVANGNLIIALALFPCTYPLQRSMASPSVFAALSHTDVAVSFGGGIEQLLKISAANF